MLWTSEAFIPYITGSKVKVIVLFSVSTLYPNIPSTISNHFAVNETLPVIAVTFSLPLYHPKNFESPFVTDTTLSGFLFPAPRYL